MSIFINVVNQRMSISSTYDGIVSGTQQFVEFRFNLSEDWDGLMPFAQFVQNGTAYNQYLDENNCVTLPSEIGAGNCTLMLYGSNGTKKATTNFLTLKISRSILVEDAGSTGISQSLYDQLIANLDEVMSFREINKKARLRFWVGTTSEYEALEQKENNVLYLRTDDNSMTELENSMLLLGQSVSEIREELIDKTSEIEQNISSVSSEIQQIREEAKIKYGCMVFGTADTQVEELGDTYNYVMLFSNWAQVENQGLTSALLAYNESSENMALMQLGGTATGLIYFTGNRIEAVNITGEIPVETAVLSYIAFKK